MGRYCAAAADHHYTYISDLEDASPTSCALGDRRHRQEGKVMAETEAFEG